jgi:tRNA pseudouridine38-40 synthase
MAVRKIKLVVQYDGTAYHGWAAQPGQATVQGTIEDAIEKLTACRVEVSGSSRTDAGVHALGQVAAFAIDCPVPTENFARALNSRLPEDIAILDAIEVSAEFDPARDAVRKMYRYSIYTGPVRPALQIRYCWHVERKLNAEAMASAGGRLVGKKDFKSFASAADTRESSVRTVYRCDVRADGDWVYIETEADGFLYNMVRNIVGTLVEIGRGRWPAEKIDEILEARDRRSAGQMAPPQGLCLVRIEYAL